MEKPVPLAACQKKSGEPRQQAFAIPGRPATSRICRRCVSSRHQLLVPEGGAKGDFFEDLLVQPIVKRIQSFAAIALQSKKNRLVGKAAGESAWLVWNDSHSNVLLLRASSEKSVRRECGTPHSREKIVSVHLPPNVLNSIATLEPAFDLRANEMLPD